MKDKVSAIGPDESSSARYWSKCCTDSLKMGHLLAVRKVYREGRIKTLAHFMVEIDRHFWGA